MNKLLVALGALFAATSAFVYFNKRSLSRKVTRMSAATAATMLSEAWGDHHTRA